MLECTINGTVKNVGKSRDNGSLYVNIACYPNSNYTVSVLKVPLNLENDIEVGSEIGFSVTPKAFYSNKQARVLYYYKNII